MLTYNVVPSIFNTGVMVPILKKPLLIQVYQQTIGLLLFRLVFFQTIGTYYYT